MRTLSTHGVLGRSREEGELSRLLSCPPGPAPSLEIAATLAAAVLCMYSELFLAAPKPAQDARPSPAVADPRPHHLPVRELGSARAGQRAERAKKYCSWRRVCAMVGISVFFVVECRNHKRACVDGIAVLGIGIHSFIPLHRGARMGQQARGKAPRLRFHDSAVRCIPRPSPRIPTRLFLRRGHIVRDANRSPPLAPFPNEPISLLEACRMQDGSRC